MQEEILTKYIAIWGWQILAIIFLCTTFIMFSIPRNLNSAVFSIALFGVFVGCEAMVIKRKRELQEDGS